MGCGSNNNAADQLRQQQQQQQAWTNQSVANINKAFSGFTPQFYQGIGDAYMNWALPQLNNQYQQTANQLGAKLANQGISRSSGAQNAYNQLQNTNQLNQQQIAGTAQQQSNQLRQQIGQEQSNLYGQAQTATNPSAIGQQALMAAQNFSLPSAFQPLGNLFSNFANTYLASQLGNTYNPATQQLLASLSGGGL